MKSITADMFHTVRKALTNYISRTGVRRGEIPTTLCRKFLEVASETLSENGIESGAAIVMRNGHPHLLIEEECNIWEGSNTLCVGGVRRMEDGPLKEASMAFLAAFIRNNPFISYSDSVWSCLTEAIHTDYPEGLTGFDVDEGYLQDMQEAMTVNMGNEEALNLFFQEVKAADIPSREALADMLDAVAAESEWERELLDTLKAGVPYAFEKRWDDSDFDGNSQGYACVCVSPWDYFCVNLAANDPFAIGVEMTGIVYDGDAYFDAPRVQRLLLDDGTLEDIYDREGFSAFCNRLSAKLSIEPCRTTQ